MKKNSFTMVNDKGEEVLFDVLFTFDNDENNKSYIVYTDNTKDEVGNIKVFASIYDPSDMNKTFEDITTEKEWKVIETILGTIQDEVKNKKAELEK